VLNNIFAEHLTGKIPFPPWVIKHLLLARCWAYGNEM